MSDFAYDYFDKELDKLAVPELKKIFEKVKRLLSQKSKNVPETFSRKLGGLEQDFYIASDFDETPDCFKEYM